MDSRVLISSMLFWSSVWWLRKWRNPVLSFRALGLFGPNLNISSLSHRDYLMSGMFSFLFVMTHDLLDIAFLIYCF